MVPLRQITAAAFSLADELLEVEKLIILKPILAFLQTGHTLILDGSMYTLVRLILVLLDRLSFLI